MQRFHSKVDLWLVVVLVLAIVLQIYAMQQVLSSDAPLSSKYVISASTVLVISLVASLLLRTHYTIDGDTLRIVSGPFYRNVKISSITAIMQTRNPLSSPALSLDRLKIRYADGRSVMISPDDQQAFLAALGANVKLKQK